MTMSDLRSRSYGRAGAAVAARPALLERAVGEVREEVAATAWPAADPAHFAVLDEGDELLVLADLPGARDWELHVYACSAQLWVHLRAAGRRYMHPLPAAVDPASVRREFRNGILAVWLTKCRIQGG